MAVTKDGSAINMPCIEKDRAIKRVGNGNNEIGEVGFININGTRGSKLAKSKDLV